MEKLFALPPSQQQKNLISKGLAPVVCYEPWFPRCIEAIKQSIHDGHPVLIRFHSGASYPTLSDERYSNDLESHAVLIVGYDDSKRAFAIIDPWNKNWGGVLGGKQWVTFEDVERRAVDCSMGMCMFLAPLSVNSQFEWDKFKNLSLKFEIGFYIPTGTIMDRKSWSISELTIKCITPKSWNNDNITRQKIGKWAIGDTVIVSLPLINNPLPESQLDIIVNATIIGERPYPFSDNIELYQKIEIPQLHHIEMEQNSKLVAL